MSTRKNRFARLRSQLALLGGLTLLWTLLWGEFSWLNIITGALLGILVSVVFYLPAVALGDRLNPWRMLVFLTRLLFDIARGSIEVAALALAPHYIASNAILAIHLRTRSDLISTAVAVSTSIVPGSLVVDIDRVDSTLYLHVLNVTTMQEAEQFRRSVLATERRIVLAVGSREDVERMRRVSTEEERAGANREWEETE